MKLKGTLKMERNTIVTLLIVSIGTLCTGFFIELILQALISKDCYRELHIDFVTNVALGVAGSATISLLCLIFPHLEKKKSQESRIINLVRKVYCDYARVISRICSNYAREKSDESYMGEIQLEREAQQLSESIIKLSEQYRQMEVSSDGIDRIVAEADSIIALTEIVKHFLLFVMPDNADLASREDEKTKKKKCFDFEENQELYLLLLRIIEEIISQNSMKKLFEKYISHGEAVVVNLRSGTKDLLIAIGQKRKSDKTVCACLKINLEIMRIREKYFQKENEQYNQVWSQIQKIIEIVKGLPKDVAERSCAEIVEIHDMLEYQGYIATLERTKQLQEELSQISHK